MKKLFISALALGAPFALVLGIAEWRLTRTPWNEYAAKRGAVGRQIENVQVLVMGSSHAYHGILPDMLDPHAFNLSAVSQTLYYDCALIEQHLDRARSLKRVVLPISFFTLGARLDRGIEKWRCYYYAHEYGILEQDWRLRWEARNYCAYFLAGEQLGFRKMICGTLPDARTGLDSQGGLARPENATAEALPSAEVLRTSAQAALNRHQGPFWDENFAQNAALLETVLHRLRQRGIEVILVTIPVSQHYSSGMNPGQYQRMQVELRRLSEQPGVVYLNYTGDPRFDDGDFRNADHLNRRGAEKFTEILRQEMNLNR
jgi:hypothetical protein